MKTWAKRITIALLAVAGSGCAATPSKAPASPRLAGLAWIVGDWEGASEEGGATDEHWIGALQRGVDSAHRLARAASSRLRIS